MTKRKIKRFFVLALILCLFSMYGAFPSARAASLTDVSDTLSDSTPSATATHTVQFTTGSALATSSYMEVTLVDDASWGDIATGTCPTNTTISTTTNTIRCTADTLLATGTYTIIIRNVTNPSVTGAYQVNIDTKTSGGTEIESANVQVYIVDSVTVSATVNSSLTFTVGALATSTVVNGATITRTSTANALAFGELSTAASSTMGHSLSVVTNAGSGFTVTVQQDGEMQTAAGATINSFNNSADGSGSTTPQTWVEPYGNLGDDWTYGHMGLTTDDSDLGYGNLQYTGLNGTNPTTVLSHNGPADGTTQDVGYAKVAYTISITGLQEAGDYQSTLTYIVTPTY